MGANFGRCEHGQISTSSTQSHGFPSLFSRQREESAQPSVDARIDASQSDQFKATVFQPHFIRTQRVSKNLGRCTYRQISPTSIDKPPFSKLISSTAGRVSTSTNFDRFVNGQTPTRAIQKSPFVSSVLPSFSRRWVRRLVPSGVMSCVIPDIYDRSKILP